VFAGTTRLEVLRLSWRGKQETSVRPCPEAAAADTDTAADPDTAHAEPEPAARQSVTLVTFPACHKSILKHNGREFGDNMAYVEWLGGIRDESATTSSQAAIIVMLNRFSGWSPDGRIV
jgi:hypothetical protein